jgi:hypothetical protein
VPTNFLCTNRRERNGNLRKKLSQIQTIVINSIVQNSLNHSVDLLIINIESTSEKYFVNRLYISILFYIN